MLSSQHRVNSCKLLNQLYMTSNVLAFVYVEQTVYMQIRIASETEYILSK